MSPVQPLLPSRLQAERFARGGHTLSADELEASHQADEREEVERLVALFGLTADSDKVTWDRENLGLQSRTFVLSGERWNRRHAMQPPLDASVIPSAHAKTAPPYSNAELLEGVLGMSAAAGANMHPSAQLKRERQFLRLWAEAVDAGDLVLPDDSLLVIPRVFDSELLAGHQGEEEEESPSVLVTEDLSAAGFEALQYYLPQDNDSAKALALALADFHAGCWQIRARLHRMTGAISADTPTPATVTEKCAEDEAALRAHQAAHKAVVPQQRLDMKKSLQYCVDEWRDVGTDEDLSIAKQVEPALDGIVDARFDEEPGMMLYCHNDGWAHNAMFRYNDASQVTGVALVDFASVGFGSPVADMVGFLKTSRSARTFWDAQMSRPKFAVDYALRLRAQLPEDKRELMFTLREMAHALAMACTFFLNRSMWKGTPETLERQCRALVEAAIYSKFDVKHARHRRHVLADADDIARGEASIAEEKYGKADRRYLSSLASGVDPPPSNQSMLAALSDEDTSLETLILVRHTLTPEQTNDILAALKVISSSVHTLVLFRTVMCTKTLGEALGKNVSLRTLALPRSDFGPAGTCDLVEGLKLNHALRSLNLWGNDLGANGAQHVASYLSVNTSLVSLDLRMNGIDATGAEALAQALSHNATLEELNLSDNKLGPDGCTHLSRALKHNKAMRLLDLTRTEIGHAGFSSLAAVLAGNTTLGTLVLAGNGAETAGADAFFDALSVNTGLHTLDVSSNLLQAQGMERLCHALARNQGLQVLNLSYNACDVAGASLLARALENNTCLHSLDVSGNMIGDEGVACLAKALVVNSTLRTLVLRANFILPDGFKALAGALEVNTTLKSLDVASNGMRPEGSKAMARALRRNQTLQTLNVNGANLESRGAVELLRALNDNTALRNVYMSASDLDASANDLLREVTDNNVLLTIHVFSNVVAQRKQNTLTPEALKEMCTAAVQRGVTVPWGRCKLMLIGQGRAGKTQTLRNLRGQVFQDGDEASRSTALGAIEHVAPDHSSQTTSGGGGRFGELSDHAQVGDQLARGLLVQVGYELEVRKQPWTSRVQQSAVSFGRATVAKALNPFGLLSEPSVSSSSSSSMGPPPPLNDQVLRRLDRDLVFQADAAATQGRDPVSFTVWDCGGQEVFHTVHHMFLSSYGVYVLVFDMSKLLAKDSRVQELHALRFWLNSVSLHAAAAPVLVVGTHADLVSSADDLVKVEGLLSGLKQSFDGKWLLNRQPASPVELFFPLDNKNRKADGDGDGTDVVQIREMVVQQAQEMSFVKRHVPLAWSLYLDKLIQTPDQPSLSLAEWYSEGQAHGLTTQDLGDMLEYCHELGVLLHWRAIPELRDVVIVEPQWLVNAIARVIHHSAWHDRESERKVRRGVGLEDDYSRMMQSGVASSRLLKHIWRDYGADKFDFLVGLMKNALLMVDWKAPHTDTAAGGVGAFVVPALVRCEVPLGDGYSEHNNEGGGDDVVVVGAAPAKAAVCDTTVATAVLDFGEFYLPMGLFQRVVVQCIEASTNSDNNKHGARKQQQQQQQQEPAIGATTALVWFGECAMSLRWLPTKERIVVGFSVARMAGELVNAVAGMVERVRNGVLGGADRLRYDVLLSCDVVGVERVWVARSALSSLSVGQQRVRTTEESVRQYADLEQVNKLWAVVYRD